MRVSVIGAEEPGPHESVLAGDLRRVEFRIDVIGGKPRKQLERTLIRLTCRDTIGGLKQSGTIGDQAFLHVPSINVSSAGGALPLQLTTYTGVGRGFVNTK